MRDPYAVLGVKRWSSKSEIKSAFRSLAKSAHPDNPSGGGSTVRFEEINQAYEILGNDAKREAYDRGEIGPDGRRRRKPTQKKRGGIFGFNPFTSRPPVRETPAGQNEGPTATPIDEDEMMVHIFGEAARRQRVDDPPGFDDFPEPHEDLNDANDNAAPGSEQHGETSHARVVFDALNALFSRRSPKPDPEPAPPPEIHAQIEVPLDLVMKGGEIEATLADGRTFPVTVPCGIEDGATIRVAAADLPDGATTQDGGGDGADAVLTVRLKNSDAFWVEGADLHGQLAITLADAVLGCRSHVDTLDGKIALTVPPWSGSEKVLRVRGNGLPRQSGERGDLYIHLRVLLPEHQDPHLIELVRARRDGIIV